MRIGQGFDVHAFDEAAAHSDAFVTLGGVNIAHSMPLRAHSDGDVVLHALCDAILGALALGDIGQLYPDTDARYADADSRELLRDVVARASKKGFRVNNADLTVIAELPRIAAHSLAMRQNIAGDCAVALDVISVKATTSEKLGFTGRGEGIACMAQVLMISTTTVSAQS
ncbi:MAG: 2-C-methyl-D-erythritol 2,4-cyclodiphosphate synthase [Pseudomonadales bacterium]